jgi:hypothetical protein
MAADMGLHTFFVVANTPNNPLGAYMTVTEETVDRVSAGLASEAQMLSYSGGFHPKYCEFNNTSPGFDGVCTPGQVVAETLNEWTAAGVTSQEASDEVAEVVDASLLYLQESILDDNYGLLNQ